MTKAEAETIAGNTAEKGSYEKPESKAVFVYDGQKGFWNLIAHWGWAVRLKNTDRSKESPVFFIVPKIGKEKQITRAASSLSGVSVYRISEDIFEEKTRSSGKIPKLEKIKK